MKLVVERTKWLTINSVFFMGTGAMLDSSGSMPVDAEKAGTEGGAPFMCNF